MKKILTFILAVTMLLSVAFTVVGCGDTSDEPTHTHVYVEGICDCGEVDPSYHICDMCQKVQGTNPVDLYGYKYYLCDSCYKLYTHEHEFVDGKCECGEVDKDYGKITISSVSVDTDGKLTITMSDGSAFPPISLPENKEGIKFSDAKLESGNMVLYFSDGYLLSCTHYNVDAEEITSIDARIENKHLFLTVNGVDKDMGQVFYPTKPAEELNPSGSCEYADSRDISGRDITYVDITVRDYGTIRVLLDATTAPITVANFLSLVREGFYNGLTFHRVQANFVIQGGDPKADGTGGSGNSIFGEFSANGWENDILHKRGVISMARRGDNMDSANSQFFICNADAHTSLDGKYAAFGYVVSGMNIVDEITSLTAPYADSYYGTGIISDKAKQVVIDSITIVENPIPPEHKHNFVDGKCECGEEDPDYKPECEHSFSEGVCTKCGEEDPTYTPHEHKFVDGVCECGEEDPTYVPPHTHEYADGFCTVCKKDEWTIIKERGYIVVGGTDKSPFISSTPGGATGFEARLMKLVGEHLGVDVRFRILFDEDDLYTELAEGTIDVICNRLTYGFSGKSNLEERLDLTYPYLSAGHFLVVPKAQLSEYTSKADFAGKYGIYKEGSSAAKYAVETLSGIKHTLIYSSIENILTAVSTGHFNFAVIDTYAAFELAGSGRYNLAILNLSDFGIASSLISAGVRNGSNLADQINKALISIENKGNLATLASEYSFTYVANVIEHKHEYKDGKCVCLMEDPDYVPPHEHTFVEGKCECGETDPDYKPECEHSFSEGVCTKCGEEDPSYTPPHEHNFVDGKCECGEEDSSYKPPHTHTFIEGKCECGAEDTNEDPDGWTKP